MITRANNINMESEEEMELDQATPENQVLHKLAGNRSTSNNSRKGLTRHTLNRLIKGVHEDLVRQLTF